MYEGGFTNNDKERSCHECSTLLVDQNGKVIEHVFIIDYRIWCITCLGQEGILGFHEKGENVSDKYWYKETQPPVTRSC